MFGQLSIKILNSAFKGLFITIDQRPTIYILNQQAVLEFSYIVQSIELGPTKTT